MPKTLEQLQTEKAGLRLYTQDVAGERFVYRKPNSIEWRGCQGAIMSMQMSRDDMLDGGVNINGEEMLKQYEKLAMSVVLSHAPDELQSFGENYLPLWMELGGGIFATISSEMADFAKKRVSASTKP